MVDKSNIAGSGKAKEGVPFDPHHLLKEVIIALLTFGLVNLLVANWPAPMEPPANPLITPSHIKPEWYFLASYQLLKIADVFHFIGPWAPKAIGIIAIGFALGLVFAVPFIDRRPERHPRNRKTVVTTGVLFLIMFVVLTIWGYLS